MRVFRDGTLVSILVCLAISAGLGVWAVHSGLHWFRMFSEMPNIIELNSAENGTFGGTIIFSVFVYIGMLMLKEKRGLSDREHGILSYVAIIGFVAMITVPIISFWCARIYLSGEGYKVCDLHPYHKVATQDAIYVKDINDCPYGYSG